MSGLRTGETDADDAIEYQTNHYTVIFRRVTFAIFIILYRCGIWRKIKKIKTCRRPDLLRLTYTVLRLRARLLFDLAEKPFFF